MSRFRLLLLLVAAVLAAVQTARPARAEFTAEVSCVNDGQCTGGRHCCGCKCIIGLCDPADACPQG